MIASFDIDGVIFMGPGMPGVYPGPNDIIITGRSIEEEAETRSMLAQKGITNTVFFNPLPFNRKDRLSSGTHKGNTIKNLLDAGIMIGVHYEDDFIQAKEIRRIIGHSVTVVELVHNLVEKENVRHLEF